MGVTIVMYYNLVVLIYSRLVLFLTYRALKSLGPSCLKDLISHYELAEVLRSSGEAILDFWLDAAMRQQQEDGVPSPGLNSNLFGTPPGG